MPVSTQLQPCAVALLCVAAGCGPVAAHEGPSEACAVQVAVSAASAPDRRLLGRAAGYPADPTLAARADQLRGSQRVRRAVAWEVMARVLGPVPIPGARGLTQATVPRFRTWYDRDDVTRVFQRLYADLGPSRREASARFTEAELDGAFGWNSHNPELLDGWTAARWDDYLGAVGSPEGLSGLGGIRRTLLSPDAARHLVQSYPEVLACLAGVRPGAVSEASAPRSQRLAREPVSLAPCAAQSAGPYFVAEGARITARFDGEGAAASRVELVEGPNRARGRARCAARGGDGCEAVGPGVFHAVLRSGGIAARGALQVGYTAPGALSAACLDGVFPRAAASLSLEWRRAGPGWTLPVYDSTGPAITRRYADGPASSWGPGDTQGSPSPAEIYTVQLPVGARFQLAAMHIRTREVDRWLNITLWYSDTPDSDFGEDRPVSIQALGAPWTSYKLCVTTDFDEGDPRPDGGFARDAPSLAAALRAVHEGYGGPSWCSNPYIDAGPGLVRSNCLGCHQHAMTGVRPLETATDAARYPAGGRRQVRQTFPADQYWGLDAGDRYGAVFGEIVSWWRTTL